MILTALSVSSLFYVILLPVVLLQVLALLLLPALLSPGARPGAALKAAYCYLLQAVGVSLMSVGALPAVYGVLQKVATGAERFSAEMYLALLILFCIGGLTFLWHERLAEGIDDASRKVPALLFWYTFKGIGYLLAAVGCLTFLITILLGAQPLAITWWITPVILVLYGLLLSWCTRSPSSINSFRSMPMNGGVKKHAHGKTTKR